MFRIIFFRKTYKQKRKVLRVNIITLLFKEIENYYNIFFHNFEAGRDFFTILKKFTFEVE